jgi:excisionase family DNA binding protein
MSDLSVAEAAQRLQVSPRRVRALLEDGRLPGRQVAGRWLLPSRAVDHRQQGAPTPGRPLSPASAWHALAILAKANDSISHLPAPVRSRARRRAETLRNISPPAEIGKRWQSALAQRAEVREYYAHPSVLGRLLDEPKVVRSGISAVGDHGADLMVIGGAECYVRSRDLPHLESKYALSPEIDIARANVRVHAVANERAAEWLFLHDVAPAAVVAADLIERDSSRDRTAGVKLVCRL